jgi:hypothetical protein
MTQAPRNLPLEAVLSSLGQAMLERQAKEVAEAKNAPQPQPEPSKQVTAQIVQLPLWAQAAPAAPNVALRSALFSAIQSKDRRWLNNEPISALQGTSITFKGEELNQEDLEVWLQVLNIARSHPLGTVCHTSAYGLLKSLGRATGGDQHRQLHESLIRLQAHSIQIKQGRYTYFGALVKDGIKDEVTRHYLIEINPRLAVLFQEGWTQLDTATRRKLRGKPLALWLQAHYATHAAPYPYSVAKLRELSGSRTNQLKRFREALRHALTDLQATGAIAGWSIDGDDNVHIDKVPTISQKPRRGRKPLPK